MFQGLLQWFRPRPSASDRLLNPISARVVQVKSTYYLQLQTEAGKWVYACKYHHGADGPYNYQFETAANPYALVDHSLPEIQAQQDNPTLSASSVAYAASQKPPDPPAITKVFSVADIQADPYRPYPTKENP